VGAHLGQAQGLPLRYMGISRCYPIFQKIEPSPKNNTPPFTGVFSMTPEYIVHLGQQSIYLMLLISAPMLIAGLVVGLGISILQAVTQIHEVTLTFIPKILIVSLALMIALPWMIQKLIDFMTMLMNQIPMIVS